MLEYTRPDPPPGPRWASERAEWIWIQRRDSVEADVPLGPRLELGRSAYATVTLRAGIRAAATQLQLEVATADDDIGFLGDTDDAWNVRDQLPDEYFRFGVAFPDGRATTNLPGAYWATSHDGPVIVACDLGPRGRAGEIPGFVATWTVWPTPPPGGLIVACAWPAGGIHESHLKLGGPDLRSSSRPRIRPHDPRASSRRKRVTSSAVSPSGHDAVMDGTWDGLSTLERELLARLDDEYVRASTVVGTDEHAWEALARLAQEWVMRYPLVDGRGNFGSWDDDPPADAEYTEVRLAAIGRELEGFPNAVVNGPLPHNLREVAEAAADPSLELIPDFPTGGVLTHFDANRYTLRARVEVVEHRIAITELPYGVPKGGDRGVIWEIVELVGAGEVPIIDVQDHTDRTGMRVLIEVDRDAPPDKVLAVLFERTSLEVTRTVDTRPARELLNRWMPGRYLAHLHRIAEEFGDARRTTC